VALLLKIAVIGNCHAGPLKQSWDELMPHYPNVDLRFFASAGGRLAALAIKGDDLVPATPELRKDIQFTSGGLDRVRVSSFDAFLLQGLGLQVRPLDKRLSSAVKLEAARGWFVNTTSAKICSKLRLLSSAPVYIGVVPLPRESKPGGQVITYPEALELLAQANAGLNVVFVAQPASTIVGGWGTNADYVKGATRLETSKHNIGKAVPDMDSVHMNAGFGKAFLEAFLPLLQVSGQPVESHSG
jgi:hypothetical protein